MAPDLVATPTRLAPPRWAQSIRFRLALAYSLTVFAAGTVLVAGLYLWQVRRLSEPVTLQYQPVVSIDTSTGAVTATGAAVSRDQLFRATLIQFQRQTYRQYLEELRRASLGALGALAVVAFGSGWLLAGWTLRPMRRMVAVARDVTERDLSGRIGLRGPDDELKDLADTFDEMLDRLQASFEGQRRFIQDASHELRNPLAVVRANLELVLDGDDGDPDALRDAARVAHRATGRVGHIVEDLVEQARQGVPEASRGPVDLAAVAAGVAADLRAQARSRSLTLLVATDDDGPTVHGDEPALRRAVTNLLVNAVRLAPSGSTVTVAVTTEDRTATVSVQDEGPGIAPDDRGRVFDRFWRGSPTGKGLGLGLSIVQQVAQRHGGDVDVESELGVGSTFRLVLPLPVGAPRRSATTVETPG